MQNLQVRSLRIILWERSLIILDHYWWSASLQN